MAPAIPWQPANGRTRSKLSRRKRPRQGERPIASAVSVRPAPFARGFRSIFSARARRRPEDLERTTDQRPVRLDETQHSAHRRFQPSASEGPAIAWHFGELGGEPRNLPIMTRVERWEHRAEFPLLLLALAFLVAYAWPVLDPRIPADLATMLQIAGWTVWVAFAIDFAVRIVLVKPRWPYVRSHWYDVALIVLPMLRPLRLLRLLALARIMNRSAASSLIGRVSTYVIGTALMSAALAAIAVLDAEQDAAGANITTFGDALWWSATTVTTVGYGDRFPVTGEGRLIAVALMIVGNRDGWRCDCGHHRVDRRAGRERRIEGVGRGDRGAVRLRHRGDVGPRPVLSRSVRFYAQQCAAITPESHRTTAELSETRARPWLSPIGVMPECRQAASHWPDRHPKGAPCVALSDPCCPWR